MRTENSDPQKVLRTALARAGFAEGFQHVCRRCKAAEREPHTFKHPDAVLRHCPTCGMKLWPTAIPSPMRFHDLRHGTATLLLRAGVDSHRVQRILRHADVRTSLGTYGHLDVEDLRAAVNSIAPQPEAPALPEQEPLAAVASVKLAPFGAGLVQQPQDGASAADGTTEIPSETIALQNGRTRV